MAAAPVAPPPLPTMPGASAQQASPEEGASSSPGPGAPSGTTTTLAKTGEGSGKPASGAPNNGQLPMFQQPKEEEQFMELIFPGFEADTFIWNVTLAQIAMFAFTMWVGHIKANPTPCALYHDVFC